MMYFDDIHFNLFCVPITTYYVFVFQGFLFLKSVFLCQQL